MNKSILIIGGLVVVAGVSWYLWSTGVFGPTPAEAPGTEVVVTLAEQNDSGQSGTATLTETVDGGVRVVLDLTGAPEGVTQPAHIHANSCANIGGVEYPLEFPTNGFSETTLEVSMAELQAGLPLSVNVHKSAEEISVYVACGDITL